ncbi:MAG: TolC family protein [Chitinophagaceae bacterium]
MNRIITTVLLMAITTFAGAQVITGRNSSTYHATNADTSRITDIREKLVLLAMQNPSFEVADRKVNIGQYQLNRAKGAWLGILSASGNLNELSIRGNNGSNGNLYFPRYNFSLNLPLDFFSAKKNEVKIARENLYIAKAEKNAEFRAIRREVLSKYEDYLMHKEKLELQSRRTQTEYTKYKIAEKDFEDNQIEAEEFNRAESNYLEQQMTKSEMQRNYNVAKLELEEMIGMTIEEVIASIQVSK